jgi:SAM-dependent methyltransferase
MPACPVCHADAKHWSTARDYEYFTSEKEYDYFHCDTCDCIFIDPVPISELSLLYPSNYYSFVTARKNLVTSIKEWLDARFFHQLLKKLPGKELNVLDVGGGTGWLSTLLRKHEPRIKTTQIVDIDAQAGRQAETAGHLYFQGTLESFETETRYDLILMLNLIEHVSDPLAVLNKAAGLLSPQGIILIKTPNCNSLDARVFHHSYWGGLHCPRHWVIFSEKSFRQLVQSTPLGISCLQYTQGGPFWAFSFIISMYRKGWLRVSRERPVIFHPLFPIIGALTAAFDFVRRPFAKTSQMFLVLQKKED